jgi:hypothetical protein
MNTVPVVIQLPDEVKELALKVSENKQAEVNTVLNQIFTGTADWESQVDAIEVKDITDTLSIAMADAARKNAKTARLSAEKIFDAKRDEVQAIKAEYDLEDKLWLKAKQIMQIKFKAIEEKAEYKADFVKRYNAEQKELKVQIRINQVQKFNPEINRIEFESMSDESFTMFLTSVEKAYNDRIEKEKQDKLYFVRREEMTRFQDFFTNIADFNLCEFGKISESEYNELKEKVLSAKNSFDAEQERISIENEQLKKEAEEKEKQLAVERSERERIEKELADKLAADAKIEADKLAAEKKANAAPDKSKLLDLAKRLRTPNLPELKSKEASDILTNVKALLEKTAIFIETNCDKL